MTTVNVPWREKWAIKWRICSKSKKSKCEIVTCNLKWLNLIGFQCRADMFWCKGPHFVNFKIDTQYDCVRYAIMQSSQWSQSNMKTWASTKSSCSPCCLTGEYGGGLPDTALTIAPFSPGGREASIANVQNHSTGFRLTRRETTRKGFQPCIQSSRRNGRQSMDLQRQWKDRRF